MESDLRHGKVEIRQDKEVHGPPHAMYAMLCNRRSTNADVMQEDLHVYTMYIRICGRDVWNVRDGGRIGLVR